MDLFSATREVMNKITAAGLTVRRVSHAISLAVAGCEMSRGVVGSFRGPACPVTGLSAGVAERVDGEGAL